MIRDVDDNTLLSVERVPNPPEAVQRYRGLIRSLRYDIGSDDWDMVVIVTGLEGTGKSAFALNFMCDMDNDMMENFREHVVWDAEDLNQIIYSGKKKAIVHDEAGVDLFSRDSMDTTQKRLVKSVQLMRQQNHLPILCLPGKEWLDNYIRDHRAQYWVKVWTRPTYIKSDGGRKILRRERGYATIHKAMRGDYSTKTFWKPILKVRFPDYPEGMGELYRIEKFEHTKKRMVDDTVDKRTEFILNAEKAKVSRALMAEIFGISKGRISQIVNDTRRARG